MKDAVRRGIRLHEDVAAVVVGLGIVVLALAVTWASRPADRPGDRDAHPKGWPTPLAATAGMPGAWAESPLDAFRDKRGEFAPGPILLGMGWIVAITAVGAALGGRSVGACLPGAVVLAALAGLAYLLAGQKVVKYYNLEYPLWALAVGLLVGNTVGVPRWLAPAVAGEFLIKTGLVIFGAEVLVSRLLALGLPGLMTAWLVTPVVLVATYLLGVHVLRIPSRALCMTLSADMSVCGVSAAIATGAACRAKKEELSLAIGLSLFFTVIMMVAMPPVIRWLGLDPILGGAVYCSIVGLKLEKRFADRWRIYAKVRQFDTLGRQARRAEKRKTEYYARTDIAIFTVGVAVDF